MLLVTAKGWCAASMAVFGPRLTLGCGCCWLGAGVVCRLRHLATNMLLAVEEPVHGKDEKAAPRICMRSQREGNTTLWKLHSFTAEPSLGANEALLREQCHVFLQHARGMWLTIGGRIQEEEKVPRTALSAPSLWPHDIVILTCYM